MKVIQKMSPLNRKPPGKKFIRGVPHEVQPLTTLSQGFIFAILTGKYEKRALNFAIQADKNGAYR